jgi:hypothetical protein
MCGAERLPSREFLAAELWTCRVAGHEIVGRIAAACERVEAEFGNVARRSRTFRVQ